MTAQSLATPVWRHAFGDFILDSARRDLWSRNGTLVAVTPRIFNALELFVEHPFELLRKDWLMAHLWPDLVVEENNLSQVISDLRRVLRCDGRCYIRTEPRRGFRFVCSVTQLKQPEGGKLLPNAVELELQASPMARQTPA